MFFPGSSPAAALLAALAVFAVAFAARPVGSVLFGHVGDRLGRRPALAAAVISMAGATFVIGLLPGFAAIGVAAPALLVLARLVQGLAAGGEVSGASTLLAESSSDRRRGLVTSATQVASITGLLLASGVVALVRQSLDPDQIAAWGWRVPFLLALPTGLVGLYVRNRLEEPSAFDSARRDGRLATIPAIEVFRTAPRSAAQAFGVCVLAFAGYYTVFVYLSIYLHTTGKLSPAAAIWSTTATLVAAAAALPLFGALSDRVGRRPVLAGAAVGFLVLTLPMFRLMHGDDAGLAVFGQVTLGLCVAGVMGPLWAALAELFATPVRVSGMGIAFNLAAALVGGTAPYLCAWLVAALDEPEAPAWFIMGCAMVTILTLAGMKETAGSALRT